MALVCNLKEGRISSIAGESMMWFVTELFQVTFPLLPISAKLSLAPNNLPRNVPPLTSLHAVKGPCITETPGYLLLETVGTRGKAEWFIAGHIMEVAVFKDNRALLKVIEEINARS